MDSIKKKYQLFVPHFEVDECLSEIKECLEKGWTGLGYKTVEIENNWKKYTGHTNAHFLNSNTSGLHLAVKIFKDKFNWKEDDEIISTPMTFVSSNHAIMYENLKPIFADIDDTLCLSPTSIEKSITPKTRAIIYVGFGGNSGSWNEVVAIAKKHNLILILDAAHMAGARYEGKHVGSGADCTVYSFQAVKNLPTADSGMICFRNTEDDVQARKLSWLGINKDTYARSQNKTEGNYKWQYEVDDLGFKYHGNSIMASLALVGLRYLDRDNDYRRKLSKLYEKYLSDTELINFIPMSPHSDSSRHLFQIRVPSEKRENLLLWLNENNIFPGVHYRINTDYSMYQYAKGSCPNAEKASLEVISLPLHMSLNEDDIKIICATIKNGLKQ